MEINQKHAEATLAMNGFHMSYVEKKRALLSFLGRYRKIWGCLRLLRLVRQVGNWSMSQAMSASAVFGDDLAGEVCRRLNVFFRLPRIKKLAEPGFRARAMPSFWSSASGINRRIRSLRSEIR